MQFASFAILAASLAFASAVPPQKPVPSQKSVSAQKSLLPQKAMSAQKSVAVQKSVTAPTSPNFANPDWAHDANGNLGIIFSDQTIKIGTAPIDVILGNLSHLCPPEGQCETNDVDIGGYKVADGGFRPINDETITIRASGSYPSKYRDPLLKALGEAIKKAMICKKVTDRPICGYGRVPILLGCPSLKNVDECTVPNFWGINYQSKDSSNAAPPFIGIELKATIDSDGFCSTFTTVGGAIAGAVSGVGGAIFSLFGLFCQK